MGTRFTVTAYATTDQDAETAITAALDRITALDLALSDYRPESELSRIGFRSPVQQAEVSDDLWRVLLTAARVNRQSDGAFDPTIGPLTQLWRAARTTKTSPSQPAIDEARSSVGAALAMEVDPDKPQVTLKRPGMRLDLGGIAKGYAVDEALHVLRQRGIAMALVDGGGDIAIGDPPPERQGWTIGVAALDRDQPPQMTLTLSRCGVATSGDLWQYVEIDGKRYSHLIDPRTGWAVKRRGSVTVVAPTATQADAWASVGSVAEPQEAVRFWSQTPGVSGLILWRPEDAASDDSISSVRRLASPEFPAPQREQQP